MHRAFVASPTSRAQRRRCDMNQTATIIRTHALSAAQQQAQRLSVLELAQAWLGTPYHHQARIQGVGVDCATLLCEVYHAAGVSPFVDPTPYPQNWHVHRADERYMAWVDQFAHVTAAEPQLGDLLLFKFGRAYSHGGIYAGDNQVIHSLHGHTVLRSSLDDAPLQGRSRITYTFWAGA
jgi:NlpC/P60 family putative phage cell wall peptidase